MKVIISSVISRDEGTKNLKLNSKAIIKGKFLTIYWSREGENLFRHP